jgi:hypothetical protein
VCNTYLLHLCASRRSLSHHCTRRLRIPLQPHLTRGVGGKLRLRRPAAAGPYLAPSHRHRRLAPSRRAAPKAPEAKILRGPGGEGRVQRGPKGPPRPLDDPQDPRCDQGPLIIPGRPHAPPPCPTAAAPPAGRRRRAAPPSPRRGRNVPPAVPPPPAAAGTASATATAAAAPTTRRRLG